MHDIIYRENFREEIYQSDIPVLLDFFALWCAPCRMLSAVLDTISDNYYGVIKVRRINVDSEPELSARYEVYEIPTVIFFKNGIPVNRFTGFRNAEEIEAMISKI